MTPEMLERTKECKTPGERRALMAEEGVELTDEQLEGISGGGWGDGNLCPKDPTGMQSHKWRATGVTRGNNTGGPGNLVSIAVSTAARRNGIFSHVRFSEMCMHFFGVCARNYLGLHHTDAAALHVADASQPSPSWASSAASENPRARPAHTNRKRPDPHLRSCEGRRSNPDPAPRPTSRAKRRVTRGGHPLRSGRVPQRAKRARTARAQNEGGGPPIPYTVNPARKLPCTAGSTSPSPQ